MVSTETREIELLKKENAALKKHLDAYRKDSAQKENDAIRELDLISESIPNVIWKAEILEDGSFANAYMTGAVNELLGLAQGTLKENDWDKYFSYVKPEYLPGINQCFQNAAKDKGKVYSAQYEVKKGTGENAWFYSSGRIYHISGKDIAYGFTIDISDRVNADIEIKEKQAELEEHIAAKDRLLSIISHDLKSPFTSMSGFAELCLNALKKGNNEKAQDYITNVINAANDTQRLLDNLLIWSRSRLGKLNFAQEYFNINKLVSEVTLQLKAVLNKKNIKIINNASNIDICADRNMLAAIVRNLMSNAIKFSYSGDDIFVYARLKDDSLLLSVEDNGIGIKEKNIEKMLQKHSRFSTPGTLNETGSGLGLILIKEFIAKHNGELYIQSSYGKGSTFSVSIPNQNNKSKEKKRGQTILIADDEEVNFHLIQAILGEDNYKFAYAENGQKAVDLCFGSSEIGMVLMDLSMPVMNGLNATKMIKKRLPALPVIIQTAYSSTEDKEASYAAGCNDFMTKPIRESKLKDLVYRYIES